MKLSRPAFFAVALALLMLAPPRLAHADNGREEGTSIGLGSHDADDDDDRSANRRSYDARIRDVPNEGHAIGLGSLTDDDDAAVDDDAVSHYREAPPGARPMTGYTGNEVGNPGFTGYTGRDLNNHGITGYTGDDTGGRVIREDPPRARSPWRGASEPGHTAPAGTESNPATDTGNGTGTR